MFDHHKLDVYHRALELLDTTDEIAAQLPPRRAHLREQLDQAATSIVANIAEGAGEFSRKEKARFYRMARRSANELAAWLEIIARRREAEEGLVRRALVLSRDVVSMLVRLIRGFERGGLRVGQGQGHGQGQG